MKKKGPSSASEKQVKYGSKSPNFEEPERINHSQGDDVIDPNCGESSKNDSAVTLHNQLNL